MQERARSEVINILGDKLTVPTSEQIKVSIPLKFQNLTFSGHFLDKPDIFAAISEHSTFYII